MTDAKDILSETKLISALREGSTRDAGERVCTVDRHNIPTPDGCPRSEMRLNNLWHRATFVIIRHELLKSESVNYISSAPHDICNRDEFLLVQRRSRIKDYCPGKLDPSPGGVVGFGESYLENAGREMEEEMGINFDASGNEEGSSMKRLFTFPFENERVRFWGELFEVTYCGDVENLKLQEEEVEEVLRMSFCDVQASMAEDESEWLPDGLHALKLYLQYYEDEKVGRRRLTGTSVGNLDAYLLRPRPKFIFFDCDDCLYFDSWNVAKQLTMKIEEWFTSRDFPEGLAYELYKKHGTALRGLMAEGHFKKDDPAVHDFLNEVHDIPIHSLLSTDSKLRDMLLTIDPSIRKFVFTASVRHHAERCLEALGIADLFEDIIDVTACNFATKHSKEAFRVASRIAGATNPEECLFFDDSVRNIQVGREFGWRSVLVGRMGRDCGTQITTETAEHEIDSIHSIPTIYPDLFTKSKC